MAYLVRDENLCSYIIRELEKDNLFVIDAIKGDEAFLKHIAGDIITTESFYGIINHDRKILRQAEVIAEINNEYHILVYKTSTTEYQIVKNGVIIHSNKNSDEVIKILSKYQP